MNFWLLLLAVPAAALSIGLTVIIIKTMHCVKTYWYIWDGSQLAEVRRYLKDNHLSYTEFKSGQTVGPWVGIDVKWFNQNSPSKRKLISWLEEKGFHYEIVAQA